MKVVKREGVNAPYGKCVECGTGTRSHVLEYPDYEEYEEQVFRDLEEYQAAKKGEEPEEDAEFIVKYRRLSEPEVMCHKCWVIQREKAVKFLNKHKDNWSADLATYMTKVRKFLKDWKYFDFSSLENTVVPPMKEEDHVVQDLRKQVKSFLVGSEEE